MHSAHGSSLPQLPLIDVQERPGKRSGLCEGRRERDPVCAKGEGKEIRSVRREKGKSPCVKEEKPCCAKGEGKESLLCEGREAMLCEGRRERVLVV